MSVDKLNQRSNNFSCVLNVPHGLDDVINKEKIYKFFVTCGYTLTYIAVANHNLDTDDYGNRKTLHYHVVLSFDENMRVATLINYISEGLHLPKNCISVEKCGSIVMQTRYLIHLDDIDKFQYDIGIIKSNDMPFVHRCMKYIKTINSIDDLIAICKGYRNPLELMCAIGLDNYKKYRNIIRDIYNYL